MQSIEFVKSVMTNTEAMSNNLDSGYAHGTDSSPYYARTLKDESEAEFMSNPTTDHDVNSNHNPVYIFYQKR